METLKLRQINAKLNGIFKPSVINLSPKDYQLCGNILSLTDMEVDFESHPSAEAGTESVTFQVIHPGFLRMQALKQYYLPMWPIPEPIGEFAINLELYICSNQTCVLQDQCLTDSFVVVQKIAEKFDILLLYFDFSLEYLHWKDIAKAGKTEEHSPLNFFINLLSSCKPSIAIFDGLDVFRDSFKDRDQIPIQNFWSHVLNLLQPVDCTFLETSVIGICRDFAVLNTNILAWFSKKLYLNAPNSIQRKNYLKRLGYEKEDMDETAQRFVGQSYSDIYRSVISSKNELSDRLSSLSFESKCTWTLEESRNTYLSSALETKPNIIEPIFGYRALKEKLSKLIINPLSYPNSYRKLGIASTKGILLHGPSGCGKSALVTSISKSANLPLITLKPHEIFSKYLGDSEKSLRNLFSLARSNAPCILFLDFFEILAPRRKVSSEESGVEERVLSTLLNEMDGVCEISGGVVVVGATTRLEDIDDAFLRPGRFDQIVNVDLPNFGDRLEIISGVFDLWLSAKQCQTIAEGSQGWNCADIVSFKRYLYFKTVCNGLNVSDVDMEKQIDLFNTLI